MNVAELLAEVEGWGGTVDLDQDKLVVDVPEAFPDAIVERLRIHKPEIVHHLTQRAHLQNHQDYPPVRYVTDTEPARRAVAGLMRDS